jgi:peptidoglycan/LPS O-acetylase OafA/YrhL
MFFYPGELDHFPYIWMLFYIVNPLLVAFSFWRLGHRNGKDTAARGTNPLIPLWIVQAGIFGIVGLLLLLFPGIGVAFWPWHMTEPLSQLYSAFFLTLAIGNAMAVRESHREGIRWLAFILALLGLLVLIVSLMDFQRFKPGISTVIWFAFFGIEALVFSGLFLFGRRVRPSVKGVPV